jgi:hypothetical protein
MSLRPFSFTMVPSSLVELSSKAALARIARRRAEEE